MSAIIVECYTCHRLTTEQNTQPIQLLTPTGRNRNGHAVLGTNQVVRECDGCLSAEFEASEPTHIYTVHSCGVTRTVGAVSPEEAAALLMKDRGWRSTRSVVVFGDGGQVEFLDCELINDDLQFSKRVDWA